jgi:hypothetical protein
MTSIFGGPAAHAVPLDDPRSRFGADHQNIAAVLQEVEPLGIPRLP